jgi:hypothetical protein
MSQIRSPIRGRSPNFLAVLIACLALGGCASSNRWDPHAPRNVVASAEGGQITVQHGDRLRLPLVADPKSGYEWRLAEPPIRMVMLEGPPTEQGLNLSPVRTGDEQLRVEYRPMEGTGPAQRTVSYDVRVLEYTGPLARMRNSFTRRSATSGQ